MKGSMLIILDKVDWFLVVFKLEFGFSEVILIDFLGDINLIMMKVLVLMVMMEFKFVSMRCNIGGFFIFLFINMGICEKGWKCDVLRVVQ